MGKTVPFHQAVLAVFVSIKFAVTKVVIPLVAHVFKTRALRQMVCAPRALLVQVVALPVAIVTAYQPCVCLTEAVAQVVRVAQAERVGLAEQAEPAQEVARWAGAGHPKGGLGEVAQIPATVALAIPHVQKGNDYCLTIGVTMSLVRLTQML